MAISLVGSGLSGVNTNGGNVTISIPSTFGVAQNDVIVVIGGHGNTGTAPSVSGFTSLLTDDNGNAALNAAWKRMSSAPDTSITCNGGGDANDAVSYVALIFRGVNSGTAIDASAVSAHVTSDPNSPSITTVTDNAAVISGFVSETNFSATVNPPTGYGNRVFANISDARPVTSGAAWKLVPTAGAENPGVWDTSVSPTASNVSVTVALRPLVASFEDRPFSIDANVAVSFVGAKSGTFSSPASMTGTGTATWVGISFASFGRATITGTGTAAFIGDPFSAIRAAITGRITASFVGAAYAPTQHMTSVREEIESRGAASASEH